MHLSDRLRNKVASLFAALYTIQAAVAAAPTTTAANTEANKPATSTLTKSVEAPENPAAKLKPEQWRKNPPVVPLPRPFNLPIVNRYKLDNGLSIQLVEDHRFPFVTTALGIKAGSVLESPDKLGVASMTADMLNEGTTTKKSKEIADEVDFIGGGMRAVNDVDFTIVSISGLSKYTNRLINILSDVLLNPTFPERELTLNKTNLIQELAIKRSEPDFLVEERFQKVLFGNHPYSVVAPTPASVEKITRADLQEFHDKHYLPNDSTLIMVGDFDSTKMKELINTQFGSSHWKAGLMPTQSMPALPKQDGRKIYLVDRPGSVQSSIRIGNVGINKTDPDYFPMIVTNHVLGGAAHSRLFLNIRERKGFTYGAYSSLSANRQPGTFSAEADVRTEVTGPSLQEFLYELERIRNVKVSDKELKDTKSYMVGSFQLGLEVQSGLAQRLLELKLYDLPDNYLETYTDKIMAVTPDDIRRVARKLIDEHNLVITVVGDAAENKIGVAIFCSRYRLQHRR